MEYFRNISTNNSLGGDRPPCKYWPKHCLLISLSETNLKLCQGVVTVSYKPSPIKDAIVVNKLVSPPHHINASSLVEFILLKFARSVSMVCGNSQSQLSHKTQNLTQLSRAKPNDKAEFREL